ncbi:MAG: hypothetical protein KAS72_11885 [Phycisphaerales bacterium]|nr:hypothetical protein [Phycisphaerales bacterium]
MRRRLLVIPVFLVGYTLLIAAAAIFAFGLIAEPPWGGFEGLIELCAGHEIGVTVSFLVGAACVVASQALFLLPVIQRRPPLARGAHSFTVSAILIAGIAAALTLGLILAGLELFKVWEDELGEWDWTGWAIIAIVLVSWTGWSVLLLFFTRAKDKSRALAAFTAAIFAGSIVEVLIVLPLDVMVRRRTDCYCATGTFYALVLAVWAVLWLTGPGIVIALLAKRRRLWWETHCRCCGYAKGPSPGSVCPECGSAWG